MKSTRSLALFFCLLLAAFTWACDQTATDAESDRQPVTGVSDTTIRIGSSLALSGHAGFLGTETLRGAQAYINYINENGGIHGRTIELIALDDKYDPPMCLANTQSFLVDGDVFALFCYVGTPTTVKILPLVEKAHIPLVGTFTGANALREPFHPDIINIRASYYQETAAAVRHLVEDLGMTRIAVFYQYDAYGLDGLRGAELALQNYDTTPVAKGSYIRGTLGVEEGLQAIMDSDAQAVVMIGTYEPCAKFIKLAKAWNKDMLFYNVSFVGAEELVRLLGIDGNGVIVSQVVPPPELPETRDLLFDINQYLRLLDQYYPDASPNSVSLEGYYNAVILVEGLRRAGRRLTREGLIEAIQSIRDYPIGPDNTISFSPTDHQGMETVYFTSIQDGRLVLITDWSTLVPPR